MLKGLLYLVCFLGVSPLTRAQTIVRPTFGVVDISDSMADCSDLQFAYDGNLTTTASCWANDGPFGNSESVLAHWAGFGSGLPNPSTVTLNVKSQYTQSGGRNTGFVRYTTSSQADCSSPTTSSIWVVTNSNRALKTDSINLPTNVKLSCLQVKAGSTSVNVGSSDVEIYEIWVQEQ